MKLNLVILTIMIVCAGLVYKALDLAYQLGAALGCRST